MSSSSCTTARCGLPHTLYLVVMLIVSVLPSNACEQAGFLFLFVFLWHFTPYGDGCLGRIGFGRWFRVRRLASSWTHVLIPNADSASTAAVPATFSSRNDISNPSLFSSSTAVHDVLVVDDPVALCLASQHLRRPGADPASDLPLCSEFVFVSPRKLSSPAPLAHSKR